MAAAVPAVPGATGKYPDPKNVAQISAGTGAGPRGPGARRGFALLARGSPAPADGGEGSVTRPARRPTRPRWPLRPLPAEPRLPPPEARAPRAPEPGWRQPRPM